MAVAALGAVAVAAQPPARSFELVITNVRIIVVQRDFNSASRALSPQP